MKQKTDRIVVGGFVTVLILISLTFFLMPIAKFSELENRYLQGVPQLTWDSLLSKKFANEAESFLTDHFPFRAGWVSVKSTLEKLRLQQENNGIYKGKDGYLFEKFAEPDYVKIQKYAEAVKNFAISHPEVNTTFMLAPTSIGMYPERLPWKAPVYPESKVNDFISEQVQGGGLVFMDGIDFLRPHASEQIFYRTDHHWTTRGAYYAYVAYAKKMGWSPLSEKEFEINKVSDSFLGSYHTRSQWSGISPDEIHTYIPNRPIQTEMYIADTDTTLTSLYDESFLKKKDQYSYFLSGVHALMTLKNDVGLQAADMDKLLIVKDSYAHSFIPFLTQHVSEIHVIDIRYYNGSISDYVTGNGIKNVLLLFNTVTFTNNGEILKMNS